MARLNKRNRERARMAEQLTALQVTHSTHVRHEGPIPAPQTLHEYEKLLPGLAERIIRTAEAESEHRRELERVFLAAQIDDGKEYRRIESRGQHYGLIVACVGIVAGVIIVISGHPIAGSCISGGTIVSLVGLFVYGRERKLEEVKTATESEPSDSSQHMSE